MKQLVVKSLTGQSYTAQAIIDRNRRINGERDISLSFLCNEINNEFIKDIETGWKLNFQDDWYHLFNEKTDEVGNKSFSGVLDFYFYMNGFWHMDEVENKSMTVNDAMLPLFDNKDYVLQIIDNFYSNVMSYSKQQNTTERFSYFVDRFNAEYNIPIGTKTVQLRNKIGVTRNDVIIHEDDNLNELSIDVDSSSFCTAIKGYYNFQKPKDTSKGEEPIPTQEYDYISPMAEKYGVIWGEPIYDERFTTLESIKSACKEKQESTYNISYSIKTNLIGNPLNEGDYVRFVAPSKNINTYVRVIELKEQFDDELELIDIEYTFGNENIATVFSKMQYEAIRDVADMMRGKKPIPISVLPKAIREATAIINAGSTTQFYYREDGTYGYNTENPLGVTRYNANGMGFSQDGGKNFQNAITYLGIVATAITSGTIDTNRVLVQGTEGLFYIDGDVAKWTNATDPKRFTQISPSEITTSGTLTVLRDDGGYPFMQKGVNLIGQRLFGALPPFMHPQVTVSGQRFQNDSSELRNVDAFYFEHFFNSVKIWVAFRNNGDAPYNFKVGMNGFGESQFNKYETGTCPPNETVYLHVEHFLGIPDGKLKQFYIEFACLTEGKTASMSVLDVKNLDII